jgi:hypothetical protein
MLVRDISHEFDIKDDQKRRLTFSFSLVAMNDHRMDFLIRESIHNGVDRRIRGLGGPLLVGYHRNTQAPDVVHCTVLLYGLAIILVDERLQRR